MEIARQDVATELRYGITVNASNGSPLFAQLCAAAAEDDAILDIVKDIRPGQPPGLLFPCVVQFLLLQNPTSALAEYFPSITVAPRSPENVASALRAFCLTNAHAIRRLLRTRTCQTTLVERSACLLPCFDWVAKKAGRPLNLIEIGTSAGLNLMFDRYAFDYGNGEWVGAKDASVKLRIPLRGDGKPKIHAVPEIRERVGIDLDPVDVSDPDERLWVRALLFPEWTESHANLERALRLRESVPLRTLKSDALVVLPELIDDLPDPVCVFHSACLYQWPDAARAALEDLLCRKSAGRTLYRVGMETALERKSGASLADIAARRVICSLDARLYRDGRCVQHAELGLCDGFARWLEWRA